MFKIEKQVLTVDEFLELYSSVGWLPPGEEQAAVAFANSAFTVCVELISSADKEAFYERFGLGKKPGDGMGHGMMGLMVGEKE